MSGGTRKQAHRTSEPPPRTRSSEHRTPLVLGINVVDGVPVLRLDRAAFAALDRRNVLLDVDDLDAAADQLDEVAS